MNFILTTIWLVMMTCLGYWIGENFVPEHVALTAFAFFFIALIIRFFPKILGNILEAVAD